MVHLSRIIFSLNSGGGVKPEEYFNYKLWNCKWDTEYYWLTESERRKILSKYNPKELYALLDSKIETAKAFRQCFNRKIFIYDVNLSEDDNRTIFNKFVSGSKVCFFKDDHGLKGKGVKKYILNTSTDVETLWEMAKGSSVLLEEAIQQHELMEKLNRSSVNTLRVLSMMINGESEVVYALIRVGRAGSDVDNAGSGGIFAPVDLDKACISDIARNYVLDIYKEHPDTGVAFPGYMLPFNRDKLIAYVNELNDVLKKRGINDAVVGWDIAIDTNGNYVMVEGNASADSRISQIAFQKSFKEEYEKLRSR